MRKSAGYVIKGIVLVLAAGTLVLAVTGVLVPKFLYGTTWATTSTYTGFYELPEDSADVLLLGSSHMASGISPQKLYDEYGITSYNLGCERQNLITSYYWLLEALRFQSPKAVVLDTYFLFRYEEGDPDNLSEPYVRKALDHMRWSSVKREAIDTFAALDEDESVLSYYFPIIRYHSRWTEASEEDFTFSEMEDQDRLLGFAPLTDVSYLNRYEPYEISGSVVAAGTVEVMAEYLERIRALCEERGISLILIKTPSITENAERHQAVSDYADEHGLLYLDFNEAGLYDQISYDFSRDNADDEHSNIEGAEKMTSCVGKILSEQYGIEGKTDENWEQCRAAYAHVKKNAALPGITKLYDYLDEIKDPSYIVFITVKDEATSAFNEEIWKRLEALGLKIDISTLYGCSYLAIISEDEVIEQMDYRKLTWSGLLRDGKTGCAVISASHDYGNISSVKIDETEYSVNSRGLNIVVYDPAINKVVDSVCFDTYQGTFECTRGE